MTIVFYISGHGFGHASREVEVMNLLGGSGGHNLLIRSAVDPALLSRTMRVPFAHLPEQFDTGIVQPTSVRHDDAATVEAALAFYATFPARVAAEVRALEPLGVHLVVGDIPPLAFEVAHRLGVPGVALANFTWDWIYETHPGFLPAGAGVLDTIRTGYAKATRALQLPFAGGFDVFDDVTPIPLIARRPTRARRDTRAYFGLPSARRTALVSFGGYGLPGLDLAAVDCRDDWTIVTTSRTGVDRATPPHVAVVPEDAFTHGGFRYEDLVAAVDVVITKPGYGIIAECIASNTAMLYTSRGSFREYDLLVDALPRVTRSRFISQAALFGGQWRDGLESVLAQPAPPEQMDTDGAEVAAAQIQQIARMAPRT